MKAIINGTIIDNREYLTGYHLLFDENIISLSQEDLPDQCEIIDAKGSYVSAGFVDMHIHGSGGADVMDATPQALETISRTLLQTGTTSFIATTMTMSQEDINKALDVIIEYGDRVSGAKIEGIHLEGPFINPLKCGAQDPKYIQEARFEWIEPYLPHIRVITIAPEMQGAEDFIKKIGEISPHTLLSIGHSDANYEISMQSFEWGISHATHLFNAMPPWHHREPGVIGALFESDVTADIIADLIHTHPATLHSVEKIKKDQLILITDAMRAGCLKSGCYDLGGQSVRVEDGRAALENGVLAGSVLKLNDAVKNFYNHTEATLIEAITAVTSLPAKRLGLPIGELREGYCADIVIFDADISIEKVYLNGDLAYELDATSNISS
ncbi:MAG: N-acetylglucosamine-6-phosphate deacetylase [Campylobacterota bacterium]|nr:N-acetylglucosamine-6-phosphate deacetylase [Campylobacterota bacterium]